MSRQVRGFSLSLVLFITSLLIGRLSTSELAATSASVSQSPSMTPVPPTPTTTPTPTPARTPTPTLQLSGTIILDQSNVTTYRFPSGSFIHPLRMVVRGREVYLLDTGQLKLLSLSSVPSWQPVIPPDNIVEGVPVQELADIALSGDSVSLLVLDRAGNVFRYSPDRKSWAVERLVTIPGADSRQHLISVGAYDDFWYLLDSNVGQIWRHNGGRAEVIPVETDLHESADFAVGQDIFVLVPGGDQGALSLERLSDLPLTPQPSFVPPSDLTDPSWLLLDREPGGYLYVIDMGDHRLRLLKPENGSLVREYRFAEEEIEMRSVYADQGKLYLASRDAIHVYPAEPVRQRTAEPAATPTIALSSWAPHDSATLELLPPLTLPIEATALSEMGFRLPGAPRSYRCGVHEGLDFYSAAGAPVTRDTPVLAVSDGEVIRADLEYAAPSAREMDELLAYAQEAYHTPADSLDVLRGRQVWIDHGKGVVSRYCHLSALAEGLDVGDQVEQGQIIGYVGNSGTPAAYYSPDMDLHLHLEIRIGDGYLGQYLRPTEIKRWLNQVFGPGT